jgi:hypothetical protein
MRDQYIEAKSTSSDRSDFNSKMKRLKISSDMPMFSDSDRSNQKKVSPFNLYGNNNENNQNLDNFGNEEMTDD